MGKFMASLIRYRRARPIERCIEWYSSGAARTSLPSSAPGRRATMKEKSTTVRHSLSEVKAMPERGEDKTSLNPSEAESLGRMSGGALAS